LRRTAGLLCNGIGNRSQDIDCASKQEPEHQMYPPGTSTTD
jgi:hypothetical protein